MKIIIVGQFGLESFGLHIRENLLKMGHEVVASIPFYQENEKADRQKKSLYNRIHFAVEDKMRFSDRKSRARVMKRIMNKIMIFSVDLIICTKDYFLDYEIAEIKKQTGASIVLWFPDHLMTFGRATFLNAGYDCLFFKDPYLVRQMRVIYKKNAIYLPECYSPIRHTRVKYNEQDERDYSCEISMIGNLHSFRESLLENLTQFDLKIYGTANPWWLNIDKIKDFYTGRYLAYNEKSKAIKYSKINLNTLFIGEVEGVNVRAFEICGCGGFQILQNKPGVDDVLKIDKEVVVYNTTDELIEKIRYYLEHEAERKVIAEAGYMRAASDHTYEKRLTRLINMTFKQKSELTENDVYNYRALG